MQEKIFLLSGVLLIILGFFLIIISPLPRLLAGKADLKNEAGEEIRTKIGFGGFIGPIPFGWANDKKMLYLVILSSLVFLIVWVLLRSVIFIKGT